MMRLRGTSVVVALFLLTSLATADAECAWVLWNRIRAGNLQQEWRVLGAFPAHDPCEASRRLTIDGYLTRMRDAGNKTMWVGDEIMVSEVLNVTHAFMCLPDTMDLRGSTGLAGRVSLQPQPCSTPSHETFRNLWRHRGADR